MARDKYKQHSGLVTESLAEDHQSLVLDKRKNLIIEDNNTKRTYTDSIEAERIEEASPKWLQYAQ